MKTSQWRWAVVENRCVFCAHLKALSNRSGDCSAGGRQFHVAGPLTAKLCCVSVCSIMCCIFEMLALKMFVVAEMTLRGRSG